MNTSHDYERPVLENLHWHALNYRTAAPQHADEAWNELQSFVVRMVGKFRRRVRVSINKHTTGRVVEGLAIRWGSMPEYFADLGHHLPVPCVVVLQDDGKVETLPLKADGSIIECQVLDE